MAYTPKTKRTIIRDAVNKKLYADLTANTTIEDIYGITSLANTTESDLNTLKSNVSNVESEITDLQNNKQDNLPSIVGNSLKYLRVNVDESGYEYANAGGGGGGNDRKHYYNSSTSHDYLGYAPTGSSTSSPVWTITDITISADGSTSKVTTTGQVWPY